MLTIITVIRLSGVPSRCTGAGRALRKSVLPPSAVLNGTSERCALPLCCRWKHTGPVAAWLHAQVLNSHLHRPLEIARSSKLSVCRHLHHTFHPRDCHNIRISQMSSVGRATRRALEIPEVVGMIVEQIIVGIPQYVDSPDRKARFSALAKIARVARIFWKPAIGALYQDTRQKEWDALLRILWKDRWTLGLTYTAAPSFKKWHRFRCYTRCIRRLMVGIDLGQSPSLRSLSKNSQFHAIAKLHSLYTPDETAFPALSDLDITVAEPADFLAADILILPHLRRIFCNINPAAIPGVPAFLAVVSQRVHGLHYLGFEGDTSTCNLDTMEPSILSMVQLRKLALFCPVTSSNFSTFLCQLKQLEELYIKLTGEPCLRDEPLALPLLKVLRLDGNPNAMADFLEGVELCGLSTLFLKANPIDFWLWREVQQALERSTPLTERLILAIGEGVSDDEVLPSRLSMSTSKFLPFTACPNLKHLRIDDWRAMRICEEKAYFGVDDDTLIRISKSWPMLEELVVQPQLSGNTFWTPPTCATQDCLVNFIAGCRNLKFATLFMELRCVPHSALHQDTFLDYVRLSIERKEESANTATFFGKALPHKMLQGGPREMAPAWFSMVYDYRRRVHKWSWEPKR
ncbi:hypothetical protein CALVIDRAFT_163328 [Calocera viscosa TUFC12733]|uniref:F-box domain-containing protein n=1 Tax=Calocera viscosa (strain TUFC12733) TaxID=1330018 RepID=A0A167LE93_CALVF|nr:hypothetical protein CALVIDRAFT_163328 [Calocera viscosa TUFC12733]